MVWLYLIPVYLLLLVLLVFGTFAILSRVRGGRYLRPVIATISKVPILKRLMDTGLITRRVEQHRDGYRMGRARYRIAMPQHRF